MRKQLHLILFLSFGVFTAAFGQALQVEEAGAAPLTPENLIYNYFLGEGIEVLNVKYYGPTISVGYFDKGNSIVGLDRGIVMSTGRVKTIKNGNQYLYGVDAPGNVNADNNNNSTVTDIDASKLSKEALQNVVRYTITFRPSADTLRFRYVFASEEYPEYACKDYNDLFGFFISGPGINGTFDNKGINIAKIPGTDLPVAINNIHPAFAPNNCSDAFSKYYHNNNKSTQQPVFDGYLDVFTAEVAVQPCQVYTIKLVIADVGDKRLDSGVFLDAKSFGTNTIKVAVTNSTAVEGCSNGLITFNLPNKKSIDYKIPLKIVGGTATQNVDYKPIAKEITIKAGETSNTLSIEAIKDAIKENSETIALEYQINSCKKDTIWLNIKDNELKQPELGANKSICDGESFYLDASVPLEPAPPVLFENNNTLTINTVTNSTLASPTCSDINVVGLIPTQLKADMIESVCFTAEHNRLEDLDVYLIAPNGKFLELSTDNGTAGKNYQKTCFSPKTNKLITDAMPPFTGNFLPEGDFSDLWSIGDNPSNGKWRLKLSDDQAGEIGKLLSWNITFKPQYNITYQWSPEDGLSCLNCPKVKVTPTKSTTYKVVLEDSYGCKLQDSMSVTINNKLAAPLVSCQKSTANSVSFVWQPVPNATDYEVSINSGAWQNSNGGTYSHHVDNLALSQKVEIQVRAKNNNSKCAAGGSEIGTAVCYTLDCLPPNLKLENIQNESCYGKNDGKVQLVALNGIPPYSFQLEKQKNSVGTFVLLSSGSYTVSVTDAKGCSATTTFDIKSPAPLKATAIAQNATCYSLSDGKATLKLSGGTAPYSFDWANGKKDSLLQNLSQGIYFVTVYDQKGCSVTDQIKIEEKNKLELNAQVIDLKCHGENQGQILPKINGGEAPYTYTWADNSGFSSNAKNITDLKSGIYTLTISDKNGCSISKSFTVATPSSQLLLTVNGSATVCFGEKGQVQAFATGGTAPYQFQWNNGEKTESLDKVNAGNYQVIVSDAKGCVKKDSIKIIGLDEFKAEIQQTGASCNNGTDATAKVSKIFSSNKVFNINDFYFKWSNGNNTSENIDLQGGQNYTLTISDKLGCSISKNISITNPASIGVKVEKMTNATCAESNNGNVTVLGIGGTAPYSYTWDNQSGGQKTANASNLKPGNYTVTITDAKGCQTQKSIDIKAPSKLKISFTPRNLACKNDVSGKIESYVVGGTAPYHYNWSNGAKTANIENLSIGTYTLTVNDEQGCVISEKTSLIEPEALDAKIETSDLTCYGSKNGRISIFANGGTPPYKYSLNGSPFNGISNIVYLKANVYDITIKDVRGCLAQKTDIEINEPEPLEITLGQDTTINFGDTIQIGLYQKGFKGKTFSYQWNKRDSATMSCLNCASPKVFPVYSSVYELKVTDEKGCSNKDQVAVNVQFAPKIYVPTGFSPNADGKNDVLMIHGDQDIVVQYFVVYDKWGGQLSEMKNCMPNDTKGVWDGSCNGKKLNPDTYIWGMEVLYPTGQKETMKGSVNLLR